MSKTMQNSSLKSAVIFREAWKLLKGFKRKFWGAAVIMLLASSVIAVFIYPITMYAQYLTSGFSVNAMDHTSISQVPWYVGMFNLSVIILERLVRALFILPMMAGFWLLGINYIKNKNVRVREIFNSFSKLKSLLIGHVLIYIQFFAVILVAFLLNNFVLTGEGHLTKLIMAITYIITIPYALYILFSYIWFYPLVVDKQLDYRDAMRQSRMKFKQHRKNVSRIYLLSFVGFASLLIATFLVIKSILGTFVLSLILLATLLIWFLPWMKLVSSLIYLEVFNS